MDVPARGRPVPDDLRVPLLRRDHRTGAGPQGHPDRPRHQEPGLQHLHHRHGGDGTDDDHQAAARKAGEGRQDPRRHPLRQQFQAPRRAAPPRAPGRAGEALRQGHGPAHRDAPGERPRPSEEQVLLGATGPDRRAPAEEAEGPAPGLRGGGRRARLLRHPGPDGTVHPAGPHPRHRRRPRRLSPSWTPWSRKRSWTRRPSTSSGPATRSSPASSRRSSSSSRRRTRRPGPCSGTGTSSRSRPSSRAGVDEIRKSFASPRIDDYLGQVEENLVRSHRALQEPEEGRGGEGARRPVHRVPRQPPRRQLRAEGRPGRHRDEPELHEPLRLDRIRHDPSLRHRPDGLHARSRPARSSRPTAATWSSTPSTPSSSRASGRP